MNISRKPAIGVMFRCQYPPEQLRDFARRAEAGGLDELWIVEDCFFAGGIASTATALAVTSTINVGLGILPAVVRNPAFAAMELAALARLFPNRSLPGFGHGVASWMRQVGALPSSQLGAIEEITAAVRALLHGDKVEVDGRFVHLDKVQLNFPPEQIPPISLGVRGEKSLRLSGRIADGTIIPEGSSPAYVRWTREQIAAGMAEAGQQRDHRLTVYVYFCVNDDAATALQQMRPHLAPIVASPDNRAQLEPLGIFTTAQEMAKRGGTALIEAEMPDDWIRQLAVVGTPQECVAAIRQLAEAGADSIVLTPLLGQSEDQLEVIVRELIPLLNS
ncbi:MAG: LLM class flavin-dependent oxidoreductase [Anaerolineae bacterium]|nr:LLM class flavin-dependent oxidoreductase [Anaerolineae bacterium]